MPRKFKVIFWLSTEHTWSETYVERDIILHMAPHMRLRVTFTVKMSI